VSSPGHQILDVEQHAQLFAQRLAIGMAHSLGLVNRHPQEALPADLPFDFYNLQPERACHALGCRANPVHIHNLVAGESSSNAARRIAPTDPSPLTKKWARAHLRHRPASERN